MKKNYLKKLVALFLVFTLTFSVVACGNSNNENKTEKKVETSVETKEIKLTDQAGRKITLKKPAKTIVSCYYITTYATMALGVEDRVVGLEKKADSRPIYHMAAPELLEKTQVGSMKEFNVEATAKLKPDLVIMPMKLSEHADTLTDLGMTVLVVNPESQELLEEMLLLIGKACGVEEKAETLVKYYGKELKKISKLIKDVKKPSVYMAGNSSYLTTAPGTMYQSNLIALAGGENVSAELKGNYWTEVSYETILKDNPEVIIIPCNAEYTKEDILADKNLAGISAVKEKRVYMMPQDIEEWDSPVPSGILGTMWLTSVLHEKEYPFEKFQKDVVKYYKEFYGFEIDKTLITK